MRKTRSTDSNRGAAQVAPLLQGVWQALCRALSGAACSAAAWAALVACALWALACSPVPAFAAAEAQPGAQPEIAYAEPYFEYRSDTYGIGISLDPVFIDYISADPGGDGELRELLAYVGKPSSLWLGVGGWGTHKPGKPVRAEVREEEDGRVLLALRGIEFVGFLPTNTGHVAPIRADWVFEFHHDFLDMTVTWRLLDDIAGLQEAGWALNVDAPWYGDSEDLRRVNRDVQGFPRWIVWYGPDIGVVAAFREGSTLLKANRWYGNLESSYVIVHSWWKPGGSVVNWGVYPGGTWRVGFFRGEQDIDAAEAIYSSIDAKDGQR